MAIQLLLITVLEKQSKIATRSEKSDLAFYAYNTLDEHEKRIFIDNHLNELLANSSTLYNLDFDYIILNEIEKKEGKSPNWIQEISKKMIREIKSGNFAKTERLLDDPNIDPSLCDNQAIKEIFYGVQKNDNNSEKWIELFNRVLTHPNFNPLKEKNINWGEFQTVPELKQSMDIYFYPLRTDKLVAKRIGEGISFIKEYTSSFLVGGVIGMVGFVGMGLGMRAVSVMYPRQL